MPRFTRQLTMIGLALPMIWLGVACSAKDSTVSPNVDKAPGAKQQPLAPSAEAPRADAPEAKRRGHRGAWGRHAREHGPGALLGIALNRLDLSVQQKAKLMDLRDSLRGQPQQAPARQVRALLVQGFRSGKLDTGAIHEQIAELETHVKTRQDAVDNMLNQLHAALTPEQRVELIERFTERRRAQASPAGKLHGPNPEPAKPKANGAEFPMLRGLELSAAQRQELARFAPPEPDPASLKAHHEQRQARVAALLRAFPTSDFDAKRLPDSADVRPGLRERLERKALFAEKALSVLTREQRLAVAERLAHAGPQGKGRGGRHGKERGWRHQHAR